jgi:hypothetical protein
MRLAKNQANIHPFLSLATWGLVMGLSACSSIGSKTVTDPATSSETGKLVFTANGEKFVQDGFISRDQWQVSFDHVYVTWKMSPAKTGPAQGSSILVQGQAKKQAQTLAFALKLDPTLEFRCGAYVGDEGMWVKAIVRQNCD